MGNTIIIKEDGQEINADIHVDYALVVPFIVGLEAEEPITIELRAGRESAAGGGGVEAVVLISTFYDLVEGCEAFKRLVSAIEDGEEVFDVREHNSNL